MNSSTTSPASLTQKLRDFPDFAQRVLPGFLLATVIAIAARYLSEHYGGPAMLFALLVGMAFNYLSDGPKTARGIKFSTSFVLRLGIALLGLRITWGQIGDLGAWVLVAVLACVAITILLGGQIARWIGLSKDHAFLSAGAVAICGASAALAISAVLPKNENSERNTLLTVIGVTTLSTVAMMLYPVITGTLGLSDSAAGIFLGGTIHDVAQVVGAGYTISDEAGETAAIVKLLRVTCLAPVVVIMSIAFRSSTEAAAKSIPIMPIFLVGFLGLVFLNSFGLIPEYIVTSMTSVSQWCILIAVAGLGVKTSMKELTAVGAKPLVALVAQTVLLAVMVLGFLLLF